MVVEGWSEELIKMKIICTLIVALLVVITGNFVDATKCEDCLKGCMMSSFDGCNTCIQQVFCNYGKWTTDNHKYCTYDDECVLEIDNPLVEGRRKNENPN